MTNIRKQTAWLLLFTLLITCSCTTKKNEESKNGKQETELIIFHAGSLSVPFHQLADEFMKENQGVKVYLESAGSTECARKISELKKPCDIMASSDYTVIEDILIPEFANWYVNFAGNEMVIAFNEKSARSKEIDSNNWYQILQEEKILYGRSNPNLDPCGYRTLFTFLLAEKYYSVNGLCKKLSAKDNKYIRPKEVDLLALLEMHSLDYIFIYKSVAIQHKLKFVELPEEINQSNPALADYYSNAKTEVTGKEINTVQIKTAEAMVYAATILKTAVNKNMALKFFEFLLSEKGKKIMLDNGQPSLDLVKKEYMKNIPEQLKTQIKEQ